MPIRFACAQCGKVHRVPDEQAGRRGRCGRCQHGFTAPGVPSAPGPDVRFIPVEDETPTRGKAPGGPWLGWLRLLLPTVLVVAAFFFGRHSALNTTVPGSSREAPAGVPLEPVKAVGAVVNRLTLKPLQRAAIDDFTRYANDPSSVEVIEAWEPVPRQNISVVVDYDTAIYAVIRSRNTVGALQTMPLLFLLKGGRVAHTMKSFEEWEIARLYKQPAPPDPLATDLLNAIEQPSKKESRQVKP